MRRFIRIIRIILRSSPLVAELRRQVRRLEAENRALLDRLLVKSGASQITADSAPAFTSRRPQEDDWKREAIRAEMKVWTARIEELQRLTATDADFEPLLRDEVERFNQAVQAYAAEVS